MFCIFRPEFEALDPAPEVAALDDETSASLMKLGMYSQNVNLKGTLVLAASIKEETIV